MPIRSVLAPHFPVLVCSTGHGLSLSLPTLGCAVASMMMLCMEMFTCRVACRTISSLFVNALWSAHLLA